MHEKETIQRKIRLKTQALKLIRAERDELGHQLNLLNLRDFLEERIGGKFDPDLSRQLDAVQFLLDSRSSGPEKSEALSGRN
jgi:hypothetical protein